MSRKIPFAVLLLMPLLLTACKSKLEPTKTSATPDESGQPGATPYLQEGPNTQMDLGPGGTSLLEALKESKERCAVLEEDLREMRLEKNGIETKLAKAERDRDQERTARISAEAQHKSAADRLHESEARLLDLAIQKAQLEEKLLALQIASLEKDLAQKMQQAGGNSFASPPRGQR